ncbi:YwbE family protein [Paenibacillus elgii]|uniref:YwbE family protein n=1 Tax=Paenibacillus elgii TaxID=189691 RepID=UPI000248CD8A|nr:YwbE family protein [Paenibacillus elgii]
MSDGRKRVNVLLGAEVLIVLKQDQRTGKLTRGIVKDLLTNSATHPHGIKVRLTDGQVGRVKEIVNPVAAKPEQK